MLLKTLSNSLELLDFFSLEQRAWGVRDLAKASGQHHAVVHRVLATFADKGFLTQDPHTKKYLLGMRFLELGQQVKSRLNLADVIRPIMAKLAREEEETVFLTALEHNQGICIEVAESTNPIKFSIGSGSRFPLYSGAHAKVILAHLPEPDQMAILNAPGSPFQSSIPDLLVKLNAIRTQGWCCTQGEYDSETFGIAIPLFSSTGNIIGSLGIAGPIFRFKPDQAVRQATLLMNEQQIVQNAMLQYYHAERTEPCQTRKLTSPPIS